jgi:hypothetical protein
VLLRLAYLTVTNTLSLIRLLPMSRGEMEAEILVLRHRLAILQRQSARPAFTVEDRFLLCGLLHRLPMEKLRGLPLLVRPALAPRPAEAAPRCQLRAASAGTAPHGALHPGSAVWFRVSKK